MLRICHDGRAIPTMPVCVSVQQGAGQFERCVARGQGNLPVLRRGTFRCRKGRLPMYIGGGAVVVILIIIILILVL